MAEPVEGRERKDSIKARDDSPRAKEEEKKIAKRDSEKNEEGDSHSTAAGKMVGGNMESRGDQP